MGFDSYSPLYSWILDFYRKFVSLEIFLIHLYVFSTTVQVHLVSYLQTLIQEVDIYKSPIKDLWILHWEFYTQVYINKLNPSITSQICESILSRNFIPYLFTIFSTTLQVCSCTTLSSQTFISTRGISSPFAMVVTILCARMIVILPNVIVDSLPMGKDATPSNHGCTIARKIFHWPSARKN